MDFLPILCYAVHMDITLDLKRSGFDGETLIVMPIEAFEEYVANPLVRRLYLTDAGFFPHARSHYRSRPEGIEEYIFLCCTAGRGVVEVEGAPYPLQENEAFCIPRFKAHRYWADKEDPWSIMWVHFKGEDCPLYPLEECRVCRFTSRESVDRMEYLFGLLFRTLRSDYTLGNFIYLSQLLGLILGETYARKQDIPGTAKLNRTVTKVIRYMYHHLRENLTLEQLAAHAGLSKSSLSNAFQTCTGHSPVDFFIQLKMKEACKQLRSGNRYIYEVAQDLGYSDPYYFSRIFKKVIGTSPREYLQGERLGD